MIWGSLVQICQCLPAVCLLMVRYTTCKLWLILWNCYKLSHHPPHPRATILIGIPSAAVFFSPSVPEILSDLLGDIYVVVVSIMACRVFRRTKSGAIREMEISTGMLNQDITLPIHFRANSSGSDDAVSKDIPVVVCAR